VCEILPQPPFYPSRGPVEDDGMSNTVGKRDDYYTAGLGSTI